MKARRLQHCPDPTYSKMRKVLCFQDKTQFKSFFIYTQIPFPCIFINQKAVVMTVLHKGKKR